MASFLPHFAQKILTVASAHLRRSLRGSVCAECYGCSRAENRARAWFGVHARHRVTGKEFFEFCGQKQLLCPMKTATIASVKNSSGDFSVRTSTNGARGRKGLFFNET